jgi:DNA-binding MarR family transcriptional regulator
MTFDRLDSTGYMLNLCARLIALRMAQALRPLGVAPAQLPVLFTLSALGESTQTELAERAGIEQPTMALLLRRMERDDLIERTADNTDRRRAIVRLTEHARQILPEIETIATAINHQVVGELSSVDKRLLIALLTQVADNLRDPESIAAAVAAARARISESDS